MKNSIRNFGWRCSLWKHNPTHCHSDARFIGENLLSAGADTADSSRHKPRFGMTIPWGSKIPRIGNASFEL